MEPNHPPSRFSYQDYFRYHLTPAVRMGHEISVPPRLGGQSYHRPAPPAMHDAMWRQMEKDRIREQIIAQEIARRRILEAEVRRELMIERNLGMQFRRGGSIYMSSVNSINMEPKGFPAGVLPQKVGGIRLGESSGMSTLVRREFGSLETRSQTGANTWTSDFMPPSYTVKEKQKVILQAKPEAKISGMKRKSEVLPSVRVSELTSSADAALKKKVKEEWACALCEVSATSERALKEHRQGKRHKAKEAGLRENGKNFSIGLLPKKNLMPNKLLEIPSLPSSQKGIIPTETNSENTETNNYQAVFKSPHLDKKVKKNKAPDCRTGSKKRREPNFKFWCEMCQVGTFSETVMETHRKGKRHLSRQQNTVDKPSTQITVIRQEMNLTEEVGEVGVELQSNKNESEKDVEDTTSGS